MSENIVLDSDRDLAARSLGLDPSLIAWGGATAATQEAAPVRRFELELLEDVEWDIILASRVLPADPPQFDTMSTREVLQAVLTVVACGRAWTNLDDLGLSSEAVRKKFARLAAKGVWQALAARADNLGLSDVRKAQLKSVGLRAKQQARR